MRVKNQTQTHEQVRLHLMMGMIVLIFVAISLRLFYWQVVKGRDLEAVALDQYQRSIVSVGQRGEILSADGYPLVINQPVYRLFAEPHRLTQDPEEVAQQVATTIMESLPTFNEASPEEQRQLIDEYKNLVLSRLTRPNARWVSLRGQITQDVKDNLVSLDIRGLGFDPFYTRAYPEASMAAHVTGFVGKDEQGHDIGYFGLEGALEKELQARAIRQTVLLDARGHHLVSNDYKPTGLTLDGRTIVTTLRRDIQKVLEETLKNGVERYGAKSGEIIVLNPHNGHILGLATYPHYAQDQFYNFDPELLKNPSLGHLYEPGSTFKILTMAAGLETGQITPETQCQRCNGPRVFGQYTIKTWNDQYNPQISMREALAKSDNTAMIYVAELVGASEFREFMKRFGIGQQINLDLQEDRSTPFPERWGPVELATISFGQGISLNSLQLVRAVGAIANAGVMIRPTIVKAVVDPVTSEMIETPVVEERRVVSVETARTLTDMMIYSAEQGEAQWTASATHTVAGKTGTSQIATAGGYAADRTIASFIGFVPNATETFVMLVKLEETTSSPWAAETAAPLFYETAEKLYLLLGIPADKQ